MSKSDKLVHSARQALVTKCLEHGVTDHKEIRQVAEEVAKNCDRQQVAGVKARQTRKW
jgi:hypothetical protein